MYGKFFKLQHQFSYFNFSDLQYHGSCSHSYKTYGIWFIVTAQRIAYKEFVSVTLVICTKMAEWF